MFLSFPTVSLEIVEFVYIVQHVHAMPNGEENIKLIGAYRSLELAHAAIGRLRSQSGFQDNPEIIDPAAANNRLGFYVDRYAIDKDHWSEGFVTV